jgi:hypothetical protein
LKTRRVPLYVPFISICFVNAESYCASNEKGQEVLDKAVYVLLIPLVLNAKFVFYRVEVINSKPKPKETYVYHTVACYKYKLLIIS